jgi:hypothetical protein
MNKVIFSFLVGAMAAVVQAANTYRVTPDAPGGGDGSSWEKPMTINEAANKVYSLDSHSHIILCKAGVYIPTAKLTFVRDLTMRGGLAGTDDVTLDPKGERTIIDGENRISTIFKISAGDGSTFENLEIRNAATKGFDKTEKGDVKFINCVFDSCGNNYTGKNGSLRGGAGCFNGGDSHNNNNPAATVTFEDCVFSRNMYAPNVDSWVGFGLAAAFQNCKRVVFDNCLFVSNGLGKACLKSGGGGGVNNVRGAAIYSESPVTIRNTEFRANRAGISAAYGGVVYIKEAGSDSAFTNCLFLANSCEYCNTSGTTGNNGVLVFRKKSTEKLDVVNCTFAYNFTDGVKTSAGIDIGSGTANIKNTIFYGNRNMKSGSTKDIYATASGAIVNVDYCLFEQNSATCYAGSGAINLGANNVFGDPKFVRAITEDEITPIITKSSSYYGYSEDAYETVFSKADVHTQSQKLTVDTGDPTSPYDKEPSPNGKRVNLGYYGNTSEALCTINGLTIMFR